MSALRRLRELEQAATLTGGAWSTEDNLVTSPKGTVAITYDVNHIAHSEQLAALIVEMRNALPALLAVAEAAEAYRAWTAIGIPLDSPTLSDHVGVGHRRWQELEAALDKAAGR